ncbi:MAG: tryptophan synthase subunit alpha [Gammaproteobacteria bacterium]|nr:MAG: tryptophan synthase subunit alpha [Gammaproteobacteria bacterium]
MSAQPGHEQVTAAIRAAGEQGRPALLPFVTAGYPDPAGFIELLSAVSAAGDVVEVGVPFSDPMADGVTIQRASRAAIEAGVSLRWILEQLQAVRAAGHRFAPLVLMSYLNPLYSYGYRRLATDAAAAGVGAFIVPDLPLEEGAEFRATLAAEGLGQVQLVTPTTDARRLEAICAASSGFVYAVTTTGVTGGSSGLPADLAAYLDRVRAVSPLPVCAGFGIRDAEQVRLVGEHADGAIVGSALVEALERGDDAKAFVESLRA